MASSKVSRLRSFISLQSRRQWQPASSSSSSIAQSPRPDVPRSPLRPNLRHLPNPILPSFQGSKAIHVRPIRTESTRVPYELLLLSTRPTLACTPLSYLARAPRIRGFHTTPPRRDVIFCSIPAFKGFLLQVTRFSLLLLPLWYRWRLFKRFPKASWALWQLPVIAFCLIIALGIDQSPGKSRWRLLLMSEREEMEWSQARLESMLDSHHLLILPPTDPRVQTVKNICDRLISTIETSQTPFSAAKWPRDIVEIRERARKYEARTRIKASARIEGASMPWRPETSNPEKIFDTAGWDLFVIDLPKVNASVLPTKEVFIDVGLVNLLQSSEPLLAAVLAHEISHVTERHAVENMGALALTSVCFDILRGISWVLTLNFPFVTDGLAVVFNFLDGVVAERAYSRKLESEADELGLKVMARAGYDPRAALDLWEILTDLEAEIREQGGDNGSIADKLPFLRTHPSSGQRIKNIEKHLPAAMKIYESQRSKTRPRLVKTTPASEAGAIPTQPKRTPYRIIVPASQNTNASTPPDSGPSTGPGSESKNLMPVLADVRVAVSGAESVSGAQGGREEESEEGERLV